MPIRAATYAPDRPVPYLLEQAYSAVGGATGQVIECPIRQTSDGALVAPTQADSTVTVLNPSGTELVSGAAVTVSSSTATYTFGAGEPSASETLGSGWDIDWALAIAGEIYTYRTSAILCQGWIPPNMVTAADLYGGEGITELRYHVPQAQGPTAQGGDGTGWGPQIDAAYYAFIRKLMADGRPIQYLREPEGYREWLLAWSLKHAVDTIPAPDGSPWSQYRKDAYHRVRRAEAGLRLQFTSEDRNIRRGGSPVIRLAPVGRPTW